MIIECHWCESKVDAKVLSQKEDLSGEEPCRISFLECPVCNNVLLGYEEHFQIGAKEYEWSQISRLWPPPEKEPDWNIPQSVRQSIKEAYICFKAGAFNACAVMCGRALEDLCVECGIRNKMLAGGLKELLDKELIDKRIFQWGETLRQNRNIGAHASEEKISRTDAKFQLDFTNAICDYVFVLTARYDQFMKNRSKADTQHGST